MLARGLGELLQVAALARREIARLLAEAARHRLLVVSGGQQGLRAGQQGGDGAVFVDGEIVDDRIHRERQRRLEFALRGRHDLLKPLLPLAPAGGREDEAHAASRHPAEHPETPEVVAERGARSLDKAFGVEVADPGDDRLQRSEEVGGQRAAERAHLAGSELTENRVQRGHGLVPCGPLGFAAEKVFLRHHFENRPDVLRHAPVHQHERLLQSGARRRRNPVGPQQRMAGQQPAAAETMFDIAGLGDDAFDQLDARPFAENRARGHHPALGFFHWTAQRPDLSGGAHADPDQRAEQIGGDGQPRTLGDAVDVADQLEPAAGPKGDAEQVRELGPGAFDARWHEPRSDDRGFQEPEVIAAKVEDLVEFAHFGGCLQIHAGQADNRLVDDAEKRLDWRARAGIAAVHAQIDGDVEHPRALREIHAEEEDVAPAAVRQVHPDRGALAQDRMRCVAAAGAQQLGPDAQRLVERVAEAEHPGVAPRGPDRVAHLVGERLEPERVIGRRQRARQRFVATLFRLGV